MVVGQSDAVADGVGDVRGDRAGRRARDRRHAGCRDRLTQGARPVACLLVGQVRRSALLNTTNIEKDSVDYHLPWSTLRQGMYRILSRARCPGHRRSGRWPGRPALVGGGATATRHWRSPRRRHRFGHLGCGASRRRRVRAGVPVAGHRFRDRADRRHRLGPHTLLYCPNTSE